MLLLKMLWPVLLIVAETAPERAAEVAAAFEEGNLPRLVESWSAASPSRDADRKRLARLLEDRAENELRVAEVSGATVRLEVRARATAAVLERYDLQLVREGDDWRAWSLTSRASAEAKRILAGETSATTDGAVTRELLHLAAQQLDDGQADQAEAALNAAARLAERQADAIGRAAALRGLGRVAYFRGDIPAAVRHTEAALAAAESSGHRRGVARALHGLAMLDRVRGDYASAEKRWTAALAIDRETRDRIGEAARLNALGNIRSWQGDSAGAIGFFEQSRAIYRELNDPSGLATIANNLGIEARQQGDYRSAAAYLSEALEMSRASGDDEGVAFAQVNLGHVLVVQGEPLDALRLLQEASAFFERRGDQEHLAGVLASIGHLYTILRNFPQAIAHLERSAAIAERAGSKESKAVVFHNLGTAHAREGEHRRALGYYAKSLALDRELGDPGAVALGIADAGVSHAALGEVAEARKAFDESLAIARQNNLRETIALVHIHRAELERRQGTAAAALEWAQNAVAAAEELGLRERIWESHSVLGRVHRRRGELQQAREETERAIDIIEELRRGAGGEEMAEQAFETLAEPYRDMVGILVEQGDPRAAFEYAERAKGRVLLDVMRNGRADVSAAMTEGERARETELTVRVTRLNRELRDGADAARAAVLAKELRAARLEHEAFFTSLYAAHPALRMQQGDVAPIGAGEAVELLPPTRRGALLEFVVAEEATYLFVLSRTAPPRVHEIAVSQRELQKEVRAFREQLAGRDLKYATAAAALYGRLLARALGELRNVDELCIVPDDVLWELPFQALQPARGVFVLDRYTVFYAPSASVLRETMRRPPHRGNGLVAVGVGETENEAREIARLYGAGSRLHVGAAAREDVVKREAATSDVLHVAAHGVFDDRNAMDSRLVLSPSKSEDGFLEAREILHLDIAARLTVLSACETARGRVGAGEGLIGMSWALFVAGSPACVVSHWKVSSASTEQLMLELHRALRSTPAVSSAAALRQAARQVRENPTFRHPFYWAAFVVVGDGR